MANRAVRIYAVRPERDTPTNIIGFSLSAVDAPDDPRFAAFMDERGYTVRDTDYQPEGSISYRHVEVQPPLKDEDVRAFGVLCVGSEVDGRWQEGLIDGGNNDVLVYDNTAVSAAIPFGAGALIARS